MTAILPQVTIDELNDEAERRMGVGVPAIDAYHSVAADQGLTLVRYQGGDPEQFGTTDGPQCEVYRDRAGALVNLWIDGDFLGFDDQIGD